MPRVALFQMLYVSENYYGDPVYEISTPIGSEVLEITDDDLELLREYVKKNKTKGFIIAEEINNKIPICIADMLKEAEKWRKENELYLKKQEEERLKKQKQKEDKERKKLEELKKKYEG